MSQWPSAKARRVLAALLRIGWNVKRETGSHRVLSRAEWPDVVFAFHDQEEIGPRMLARIARLTGLKPEDLYSLAASRLPGETPTPPGETPASEVHRIYRRKTSPRERSIS